MQNENNKLIWINFFITMFGPSLAPYVLGYLFNVPNVLSNLLVISLDLYVQYLYALIGILEVIRPFIS